jgi:hypothetical protein
VGAAPLGAFFELRGRDALKRKTSPADRLEMPGMRTRPPYTVLAYVVVVATIIVVSVVHEGAHERLLYGGFLLVLASVGLVRGVWLAWLFLTVVAAGDVMLALFQWPAWWIEVVLINGTMLVLLLSRPTRRYARRGRPRLARLMP